MGIGGHLLARGFRALVCTPAESVGEEEALPGGEPVGLRRIQRLAFGFVDVLQRQDGQVQAAVIGGVFAGGQLAVLLYAVFGNLLRVLVDDALVFRFVVLG